MADTTTAEGLRRLYAEELPTGTFGGPYALPPRSRKELPRTSPEDAAEHRAVLAAAACPRRRGEAA